MGDVQYAHRTQLLLRVSHHFRERPIHIEKRPVLADHHHSYRAFFESQPEALFAFLQHLLDLQALAHQRAKTQSA